MRIIEIIASVEMSQNFWVRVPDNMPDEEILKSIQADLNVEARIFDASASAEHSHVTHEITSDGNVELLDDNFQFQWELESND